MKLSEKKIQDILLSGNYITSEELDKAVQQAKSEKLKLVDYLTAAGFLTNDLFGQAVAEHFKVPYADLNSNQPSRQQVNKISEVFAKKHRAVIFSEENDKLVVATDDPTSKELEIKLEQLFPRKKITIAYSLSEDIDNTFVHYQKPLETRFAKIISKKHTRVAPELLEEIFSDAIGYRASDIHFEPQKDEVMVRFRVDGVLKIAGHIPREHYENLLNRIKVQSGLRIDEHYSTQDGSMKHQDGNRSVDMRVSIVPTIWGEKIVIRLLAAYVQGLGLSSLGLNSHNQDILNNAAAKPFGMILVTGPTGSGKTTTLYSLLKLLDKARLNITTIEDPVEYKIEGVNQIQVNAQTNLTFSKGLRSVVRQDPDIILVGEIRDEETAEIAVNAALTGHLLFSTFHANDAATAIPRLLDMNIEPFLLASNLEVIVAQRLVRRICDKCRYSKVVSSDDEQLKKIRRFFNQERITLYAGKGCPACNHTGYKGRTGIFEFVTMTSELQDLVLRNPSSQEIWSLAREQGSQSMFEDGLIKVRNGVTTVEELLRVSAPPKA